ncbi:hypothetical protein H8K32_14290 [Undibacterium jejuense]|uniref:Uncharacterized protein n=1 Tax=Undibacterium jejuense TaxID=1344949 RepID=A0A923HRB3_9BURK|nr:hypothetical protein [Undibacterium jejuense]MBC3863273.1 hypothetical protein [Undibacterium jejuense]
MLITTGMPFLFNAEAIGATAFSVVLTNFQHSSCKFFKKLSIKTFKKNNKAPAINLNKYN